MYFICPILAKQLVTSVRSDKSAMLSKIELRIWTQNIFDASLMISNSETRINPAPMLVWINTTNITYISKQIISIVICLPYHF